ncbi:TPA: Holliday junction resolvase RuvX [Candidatus Berkelbacteria bacterium]|uniref:Putative pre-16S rRNA nuclease n=1 Tax=Berkelbacteria bacterium GW2011_GWE1_39_12 TaxID=1618337 RepID=A0A0G4B3F6_9BACT|nr:MAG: Holliday junction resolvase-like protein, putative holliday junction resolvase [Berkelbacteria bacterium GW2011_GWE1_39_12]HBO60428.1 Holliday junction resolvase RuvX [Candidatus Berkelbacteria bacterium]
MNILGLDLGDRRIGVAISFDDLVSSLDTIVYFNREEAIKDILEICRSQEIGKIVIGMPIGNEQSEDVVRSFANELNKIAGVPIDYEDETLTSKEAERILKDKKLNYKSEKYKQEIDRISAKIILEQYLNRGLN